MMPYNVRNAGGGSVGGILRRTGLGSGSGPGSTALSNGNGTGGAGSSASLENHRQTPLELLVFGYACKIFRDDEKAREMDHGKQLIPWMGDVNLKIDRYDVRGALCELAPHEAPPGGYGNRLEYLSAEEQRAEQLCEEERYLFLYNNEEELRLRQVPIKSIPTTDKETTDIPLDISRESPFLEQVNTLSSPPDRLNRFFQVKLAGATSVVVVAVGSPEIQKPTEKFPVKPKVVI
ncbi:protein suppressor of white apricot isoform X5 [Drosophila suzukii]|uniref:Protein suppressor of white apricot isoform X5 n=1 Tax=Drosophila suzukii TaxID=28584 RepID=A0ABM4TTU9_DROSZ|nr:protein suppressor of white apricot isoform X5 [Drosophila suzukii]